jgi:hypothetical protein
LVVAGGVEDEFSDQFAGVAVDDADVQVVDQEGDSGSGACGAEADVVQPAVVAQGDAAALVDAVVSNAAVGGDEGAGGGGLGTRGVGLPGSPASDGPGVVGPRCSRSGTG